MAKTIVVSNEKRHDLPAGRRAGDTWTEGRAGHPQSSYRPVSLSCGYGPRPQRFVDLGFTAIGGPRASLIIQSPC